MGAFFITTIGFFIFELSIGGDPRNIRRVVIFSPPDLDTPPIARILNTVGIAIIIYGLYGAYQISWGQVFLVFFGGGILGTIITRFIVGTALVYWIRRKD